MFTNKKKGLIHLAMTMALAVSVAQCAWAGFDSDENKIALEDTANEASAYDADVNKLYGEDNETYIIDASSPEAVSVPSTTRLTGNIQIVGDDKKVSLSLRDADVKQVLRMFADKAKMNIVFHSSVRGEVTLDLKNVPVNSALEFVLDACELTYVRQDNNIMIAAKTAAKELSYTRQNFTTLPVKYANAQSVADFLNQSMFNGKYQGISATPVVAVNASKNELMIFGTEEDENLVKKLLVKLDTKPMMNVFPVNHISPKEMATTICETILSDKSEGGTRNGINVDTRSRQSNEEEISLGGGFAACVLGEANGNIKRTTMNKEDGLVNYTSNPLTVAFFPDMGTVALYGGSREQVKMIEGFIKLHDKKQPMAYIELSLIQLSETGSKQFNTDWSVWTPFGSFRFGQDGLATGENPIFLKGSQYGVLNDQGEITKLVTKHHGWGPIVMSLNYLVENGKGRVLASPKVMVTNGKKSTIDLTSDYVKSVKQEYNTNSTTAIGQTTYDIGNDQGIKVEITPFISPEGYVVMNLKPDYSTIKNNVGSDNYTLLTRRNLELENIRVKDGETLVLAGMIQEDERQTVQKVPLLGDLPVVGPFFRRTQSNLSKEELVILITPHIVYSKDQIDNIKSQRL